MFPKPIPFPKRLNLYAVIIIATIVSISCTEPEKETQPTQKISDGTSTQDSAATQTDTPVRTEVHQEVMTREIAEEWDSSYLAQREFLKTKFDGAPYFFDDQGKRYFYVHTGKYEGSNKGNYKLGLATPEGKIILPLEYDEILSPSLIARGCIEVRKGDKYGLYNYQDNALSPIAFDQIYPSPNGEGLVLASQEDQIHSLNSDFNKSKYSSSNNILQELGKSWTLMNSLASSPEVIDSESRMYYNDPGEGNAVVFLPSFLRPAMESHFFQGLFSSTYEADFGVEFVEVEHTVARQTSESTWAHIYNYTSQISDGRGYQIDQYNLITTIANSAQVIQRKQIINNSEEYQYYYCDNSEASFKFINDTLVEIRSYRDVEDYPDYSHMTQYDYLHLQADGSIVDLTPNRFFDFTKYTRIDKSYFEGCYSIHHDHYDENNLTFAQHLTVEDLDIMRNEIFASHGYKFKTAQWQDYFSKFNWYKPLYDNVDDKLSETEQANIKTILKAKEALIRNPEPIKKQEMMYAAPG